MRRLLIASLVLVAASIVPIAAVAASCQTETPCCRTTPSPDAAFARPSCCPEPCFDAPRERREPGDAAKQVRLDRPDVQVESVIEPAPVASIRAPRAVVALLPAPDLDRRLASLATLLI